MENQPEKIETKIRSIRFPLDVMELLERWSEETGQSVTQVLSTCVRTAAEDEKCVTRAVRGGESVLQPEEDGAGVLQIRTPRTRDKLADAITMLMYETQDVIAVNDRISALGVARARVYKLTPEYQGARQVEPYSVYEDEVKLADDLSKSGGAGNFGKMREKGG